MHPRLITQSLDLLIPPMINHTASSCGGMFLMDRSHAIDRSEAKFPMQCLSGSSRKNSNEERRGIDGQLVDEIHTHT